MLVIYTSPGCASCRKAKAWMKENNVPYVEKNLFTSLLKESEIKYLLSRTENGIDDLVSKRSKVIKENNINIDDMSINQLVEFVQANPSTLKRPIIIDKKSMLVGYDEEEIELFSACNVKKHLELKCSGPECPNYETCGALREKES